MKEYEPQRVHFRSWNNPGGSFTPLQILNRNIVIVANEDGSFSISGGDEQPSLIVADDWIRDGQGATVWLSDKPPRPDPKGERDEV